MTFPSEEDRRLKSARSAGEPWLRWGPYLSERQWGTVREDYSAHGNAWAYFPHDHARSRAYRWGEDGIAGISDDRQRLCFALALWNGKDPILKERLFGLTNDEGNHGEDVKEYYFYQDSTPTHSYMRMLYKYPHAAFPYEQLVRENGRRKAEDHSALEFELMDTGVFEEERYFDVQVEYAKRATDDILVRIAVTNRGPDSHPVWVLPTLWFRNTWSWKRGSHKPRLRGGRIRPGHPGAAFDARRPSPDLRRGRRHLVRRQRDQYGAPVRRRRPGLSQGRDQRPADPQPRHRQPRPHRHQGGGDLCPRGAGGRDGDHLPALDRRSRCKRPRRGFQRRLRRPQGGGRCLLCDAHSRRSDRTTAGRSCARPSPACCGRSNSSTT